MKIEDVVTSKLTVAVGEVFLVSFKVIEGIQDSSGDFILDSDGNNITAA